MSVARNTLVYWTSQFGDFALRFVTSVFTAVILGPERRGMLTAVIMANTLTLSFTNFGIQSCSLYFVGKSREQLDRWHTLAVWMLLGICLFDVALIAALGPWLRHKVFNDMPWSLLALGLSVLPFSFYSFASQGMLTSLGRVASLGRVLFYCSVVFNGLNLFFMGLLYEHRLLLVYLLIAVFVVSEMADAVIFFFMLRRMGCRWVPMRRLELREGLAKMMGYGLRAFSGNFASVVVHRISEPFVLAGLGPVGLGVYGISARLSELLFQPSAAFESAGYARIVRGAREESARFVRDLFRANFLVNSCGLVVMMAIARPFVLLFYSSEYRGAILPLMILLPGALFFSGARMLALYFSAQLGRPEIPSAIAWVTALYTVPMLWWVVIASHGGLVGAAWVTTSSYAFMLGCYVVLFGAMTGASNAAGLFIPRVEDYTRFRDLIRGVISRRGI